jgi:hypothetical protein
MRRRGDCYDNADGVTWNPFITDANGEILGLGALGALSDYGAVTPLGVMRLLRMDSVLGVAERCTIRPAPGNV